MGGQILAQRCRRQTDPAECVCEDEGGVRGETGEDDRGGQEGDCGGEGECTSSPVRNDDTLRKGPLERKLQRSVLRIEEEEKMLSKLLVLLFSLKRAGW